ENAECIRKKRPKLVRTEAFGRLALSWTLDLPQKTDKIMIKHFIVLALLLCFGSVNAQNQFSKAQVLDDLSFLKNSLEESHYNLYAYTSKEKFNQNYQAIKESIQQDSLSSLTVTSLFQRVISKANVGHTYIDFPVQPYVNYGETGGTLFPLEIAFENGKPLVRKNWSDNEMIKTGAEVISINGKKMEEILSEIYPLISAEQPYFKNAKLELFSFPRYYWQIFGQQDVFEVKVRIGKKIKKYSLESVPVFEGYEDKRSEIFTHEMSLKFLEQSAHLKIGSFGGDEQKYQQFIDSAFIEINKKESKNLIIDLRNHDGGNNSLGDYLVSYFADKPFTWCSEFRLKTSKLLKAHTRSKYDTTATYWKEVLSHKDGEIYNYGFEKYDPQPKEKRFQGEVYVLVNRQSYSQSAVTAAQIQDYGFGTIVGEETGEYPTLYASNYQYTLPNTGIIVHVSKGYMIRVNGSEKQEGVIPDILIKDYLLDEKDEVLEGLLERIRE
ncbi:MAG: S41 family peptidase, partial [Bacteroidota bacterium]